MLDKRLAAAALGDRRRWIQIGVFTFAVAVCTAAGAYALARVVDGVFLKGEGLAEAAPPMAALLFVVLLKAACAWRRDVLAHESAETIKSGYRARLFSRLAEAGPAYLARERAGEIVTVLTDGVEALDGYYTKFLPRLVDVCVIPAGIAAVALFVDPLSGLFFVLTAPIIPVFMALIGRLADRANLAQWKTLTRFGAYFLDVLEGLATLKAFNRSAAQLKRVERLSDEFREATLKVLRVAFLSAFVLELAATLSVALIAVTVGLRLLEGGVDFARAFYILLLAPEFYLPFRALGTAFHSSISGVASARRMEELLSVSAHESAPEKKSGSGCLPKSYSIRFDQVCFHYGGRPDAALSGLTFRAEAGERIAIVGASGAGKTTIFQLLLRFIRPASGEIYIGDCPLSSLDAAKWRECVAYVPQSPHIFSLSAAENIALAKPSATMDEIVEAAKKASAHDFIARLPEGYRTKLGEGGRALSGGQARRVAIARAFLRDAPLVLLDEAATGLDAETEEAVARDLRELTRGKTVMMIAHRLHSAREADRIVVVEGGRVVECGAHDELFRLGGSYARMAAAGGGGR